jgi:trehalose 6-phosphate phosphatase
MPDTVAQSLPDQDDPAPDTAPSAKPRPDQLPPIPIDPHTNAIFLDIDGTLLDIAPTPLDVKVSDALRATLASLSRMFDGAIAFVSGRPIAEMDRLFDPLRLAAVGGHGAEIRFAPDSKIRRSEIATLDDDLRAQFARIGHIGDGVIVEDKGYSLAIHYRLAPHLGGEIMKGVTAVCKDDRCNALEILPGKAVVEIKPGGYDKGTGLRKMMSVPPFTGRKPIFVGDDVTDNAAFEALQDFAGTGFSVGGVVPGTSFNFDGPQDVRGWLRHLSEAQR